MKGLHVAVDMDDVVVNFIVDLLKYVNLEEGSNIQLEDITQWDLHPILDPVLGRSFWAWLREREFIWAEFGAVPGAIGGIGKLRRQGHYVEAVTSKPDWAENNVWTWIAKHHVPFNAVTITKLEDSKADFTKADVLIDDKPQNCIDFVKSGRPAILLTQPHNKGWATPEGVLRADSWSEVLTAVDELAVAMGVA